MLKDLITAEIGRRKELGKLAAYLEGTRLGMFGESAEHWRGVRPEDGDPNADVLWTNIRNSFLFQNLVGGVCQNHMTAVVGQDIDWGIEGDEDESISDALTEWFDTLGMQETVQDAVLTLLWATLKGNGKVSNKTSSLLRMYVPSRAVRQDGTVERGDLQEVLERAVRVMHPPPESAGMLRDEDGETIGAFYIYPDGDKAEDKLELVALDTEFARNEWDRLNGAQTTRGDTIIQIRSGADYATIQSEVAYPLGGRLTMFEMSRRALITEDVKAQQDALNANWTYFLHNGKYAFRELILTNADQPRDETTDEVVPLKRGPGQIPFVQGAPTYGENGNISGYTNVGVHHFGVESPQPYIDAIEASAEAIFEAASQRHRLISGDAVASGESRKQALEAFEASLGPTALQTRLAVRWLLEAALALAGYFEGNAGKYNALRVDPKTTISTSPPSADEQRLAIELLVAKIISMAEARRRVGVVDVEAEEAAIEDEAASNPEPPTPPVVPPVEVTT